MNQGNVPMNGNRADEMIERGNSPVIYEDIRCCKQRIARQPVMGFPASSVLSAKGKVRKNGFLFTIPAEY